MTSLKLNMFINPNNHTDIVISDNTTNIVILDNTNIVIPDNTNIESRGINYDGRPIFKNQFIIRCPTSINKNNPCINKGGVAFGFDSREEAFLMISHALETSNSLIYTQNNSQNFGGAVRIRGYVFHIELNIQHNDKIIKLDSTSSKIIHLLCNQPLEHKDINKYLNKQNIISGAAALGKYYEYHYLTEKRIYNLIDAHPVLLHIKCYRLSCLHDNIYDKTTSHSTVKCLFCNIAEFCIKCCQSSHGGECEKGDEASLEYIKLNSRKCPYCNVATERNGGCNKMHCSRCDGYWCWTCNIKYNINEVNDHYINRDATAACRILE